ncbi:glutamate--tRNA ligase [Methanocella sp. CWC-04]|uniref:Glutamate--tRNA ligase n=1 Tax=Methanooceanicella nereidis TaxID=2052831 RepID=A0AAP2W460_9EURY|nr:glutamate--tRNA ligase [Methanocella sp. CWC-04]MCD1293880.1 glutamate--tRNA ligase [Methanocella sp. CWC-04]
METKDIEVLVQKFALQNAYKYGKVPQAGSVTGKLLGTHPELKPHAKELMPIIQKVLAEIGEMSPEQVQSKLKEIAPELIEEVHTKKEARKGLPDLDISNVKPGQKVTLRIAPNPNGPPSLGNARGIVVNYEYARKYDGIFIMRFDDTDPSIKKPMLEAYQWYVEQAKWMGCPPDKVVVASDRIPLYYEYAEKLIALGHAYVCFCEQETFKELKDAGRPCPHRDTSPEENMNNWKRMLAGDFEEKVVLRIKTQIDHKDPALRDWVAFRIVREEHPRAGNKYLVWPMLDFESAMEDHFQNVTHIIRGKDLIKTAQKQKYVYDYLGWEYPKVYHWGRVRLLGFGKFSTSVMKKGIQDGEYSGWDDPRLPTVAALKRRGIEPEAIRNVMVNMGVTETDIEFSMDTLYAENRKIVDSKVNRYFFVHNPVVMKIDGAPETVAGAPLHPMDESRGVRKIHVPENADILVTMIDADNMKPGDLIRLKDLYNVRIKSLDPLCAEYIGNDISVLKKGARIIHWAPKDGVSVRVISPDGEFHGVAEAGVKDELHNVVQFERFGFARIDSINGVIVAYYTHP